MTMLQMIDVLARGGAIGLMLLWSVLLVRETWGLRTARLALAMNIGIICYLLVTARWSGGLSPLALPLTVGAGSTAGLFWLFARSWFNEGDVIRAWHYGLVLLSSINVAVLQISFGTDSPLLPISVSLFRFGMFAFAGAALWEAWHGREDDLIETRRRLRLAMIGAVGAFVIYINVTEIGVRQGWLPPSVGSLSAVGAFILVFGFCAVMLGHRSADLFGPPARASEAPSDPIIDEQLRDRLLAHMDRDMPHRDETLTIAGLAAQLGEQEYRLRRLINGQLGHRNFSAFLNGYRLAEVKAALSDPSQKEVPILTIALDAGFGSLGPFNRAFREAEGMTPTEFRGRAA
jgi:AraC-like DNA-binding protein